MATIRPIQKSEYKVLEDFLYHAIFVPAGYGMLPRDIIFTPSIFMYIEDFGKPGDVCLVAEEGGAIVGAAWSRILAQPGQKGFGNIDAQTPELSISVLPAYRGRGIGTRLIGSLTRALRGMGYSCLSLSVQKENAAARLYARLGFQTIRENREDAIMALDLRRGAQAVLAALPLEELWRLFPIELAEHDSSWADWYAEEKIALQSLLGDCAARIDHIGSTAVDGLLAKPIVDILLQVPDTCDIASIRDALVEGGWLLMAEHSPYGALDLNKGYTPEGFADKVLHLHVRRVGDWDELWFRDYLVRHPGAAAEYAALKRRLLAEYKNDRDAYTEAKADFIRDCVAKARANL
ncbi:MAG: GNAT family N-acetyltransferase [Christensenellaceae bacterium]|jgi:GrpB-like predicted nucleotidyltransferase (UPF0157 family)/ribosomal protein S18 acetylase RimI-like enzyme|nr:GNAT family N-acetyltransferase [Christensenellaceae bacterium]